LEGLEERIVMKKFPFIMATSLLAAVATSAQTNQSNPQTAPATASQAPTTATAAPSSQAVPPNGNHRGLEAKSQEEFKAYQDASTLTDAAQEEAAANDFSAKFPTSELRALLYMRAMNLYGQTNNSEKVVATGRQAIAADPTNPVPLVQVASALAESTRDTDLDREQRLAESMKDAQAAIDNIDTGLLVPPNADPARVEANKRSILTMAYDTMGMVNLDRSDYAAAASNLQKALDESKDNPEAVLYLRLSVAQDKLQQLPQALDSANKAVQYAQPGSAAENLAKQQQARLQKLTSAGAPSGTSAAPASATPSSSSAPTSTSPAPTTPSTPH
jgi:tetratricopeptide (TPR) repeat protein